MNEKEYAELEARIAARDKLNSWKQDMETSRHERLSHTISESKKATARRERPFGDCAGECKAKHAGGDFMRIQIQGGAP
jgi:hypothetical protein